MSKKSVIAIDFGTVNTYISKCPGDEPTPEGIDFQNGKDGLASAILFREGRSSLIGERALQEYGDATSEERQKYRLRSQFKPDIKDSDDARNAAKSFLSCILDEADRQHIDIEPEGREVLLGVPSEAKDDFRNALMKIAKDAGFGEVQLLDEPIGALFYHVHRKDIAPSAAQGGVLVVDFGGGTCDFAYLLRGRVQDSWGSLDLGGRLFDDLFYQWFLDQNPGIQVLQRDEYFVHSYHCREVKELFSQSMTRDRAEPISKSVRPFGRLEDMTWEEFEKRARSYRPSESFLRHLRDIGKNLGELACDNPIDLLDWFRETLRVGLSNDKIRPGDVKLVVLTGGSSQWPFVVDIVRHELSIDPKRILRSDRPYAAISKGLSMVPALRQRCQTAKASLEAKLALFKKTKLIPVIERALDSFASKVSDEVLSRLFDMRLQPVFDSFRRDGGSIADFEERLLAERSAFSKELSDVVSQCREDLAKELSAEIMEEVRRWFSDNHLAFDNRDLNPPGMRDPALRSTGHDSLLLVSSLNKSVQAAALVGTTSLASILAGGTGTAVIAGGPIGLAFGALIGAALGVLTIRYGYRRVNKMAKEMKLWPRLSRLVLPQRMIQWARKKLQDGIRAEVNKQRTIVRESIINDTTELIEREIRDLSELSSIDVSKNV